MSAILVRLTGSKMLNESRQRPYCHWESWPLVVIYGSKVASEFLNTQQSVAYVNGMLFLHSF